MAAIHAGGFVGGMYQTNTEVTTMKYFYIMVDLGSFIIAIEREAITCCIYIYSQAELFIVRALTL